MKPFVAGSGRVEGHKRVSRIKPFVIVRSGCCGDHQKFHTCPPIAVVNDSCFGGALKVSDIAHFSVDGGCFRGHQRFPT